jgi:hypothetical protein
VENIIIKFVADTSGLEPAIKQLQLLGKITDEDAAKFNAINQEQKEFIQNVNKSATEFGKLSNEVEDLAKTMSQNVLGKAANELEQFTNSSTEAMQGAKSLKAELRDLKKQIASGNFSGKELEQMTKRAAELTDHLGDVNEKIKALSSDTKRIDAVVGAMKGVAAAASVAAGATALFGTENKQMAEAAQKAQAAMALLAGVQEIAALATSENAAKTLFLDGAQKLATVSSRVLGVTITTSMAAATMGLSLVIAAVAGLALSMNDAKDKQQRLTEEMERAEKQLLAQLDLYQRIGKIRSDGYKFQADLAQAQGKSDKEILDARLKGIQEELDANSRQRGYLMKGDKDYYAKLGELVNKEVELKREKALLNAQFDKKQADEEKALREKAQKEADAKADEARKKAEADANARAILLAALSEELQRNMIRQEEIQTEYFKSVDEIDAMYAELAQDRRFKTSQEIYEEIDKRLRAEQEAAIKKAQIDVASTNQLKQNYYAQTDIQTEFKKTQEQVDKDYADIAQEGRLTTSEQIYAELRKRYQAEVDTSKKSIELERQKAAFIVDQARVISDTLFTIGQQNRQATFDAEIEQLNLLRENELANKNLTEAQRAQIEKRYAQEEAKLKRQAWEQQKQADIAQAIINTALAVTKSFATLGYPAGIPGAVGAGIAGAAQIAIISNTKPPKFADGTEFLVGAGTGRSDNNLAYLSHGERVVPAAVNSDYFPALSAIHNREVEPTFANNILTALANGTFELASQYQSAQGSSKKSLDYDKLGKVLERNKSNVNISIDENGFNKYVEKMHSRTEFRNTKMRIKV